ncbi:Carbohydrate binding domain (family 11) [Alteromonadaceae bacterium Bs31]|nr:Carbohydrate binding domain (family 11) [Alteromonadaceae bacterium Bs31]
MHNFQRTSFAGIPRSYLLLALILIVLLANTWLLFFYHLPGKSYFWVTLHDSGHSLVFLALTLCLALIIHRLLKQQAKLKTSILAAAISLSFGAAVEILQSKVGRQASWFDFSMDMLGTLAGLSLYQAIYARRKRVRVLLLSISAVLIAVSLSKPFKLAVAQSVRSKAFPLIADFDDYWLNQYFIPMSGAALSVVDAPNTWQNNQTKVLRVQMQPAPWPGVEIREVERDWTGFKALSFEAYNPAEHTVKIVVRVHDQQHNLKHRDRFNKTVKLAPGYNLIEFPLSAVEQAPKGREMNMKRIRAVMFYSYKLKAPRELYLDNIQLHPSE